MVCETDLYEPVKSMLEARGYEVKSEIDGCDVVACHSHAPLIIVELKLVFSIDLVLQGVDRLAAADNVYLAVAVPDTPARRRNWRRRRRDCIKLCRLLGLGLLTVDLQCSAGARVDVLADPTPYIPKSNSKRVARLQLEFSRRKGDPNTGGITRTKIVTAYRQDALRCALVLADKRDRTVTDIRDSAEVPRAASILQKNYYGWFERTARGVYALTEQGQEGLRHFESLLPALERNSG